MDKHLKKQIAVRLDDESHKRLARLAKRFGGKAAALEEAIRKLDGANEISREELLAELGRRLK